MLPAVGLNTLHLAGNCLWWNPKTPSSGRDFRICRDFYNGPRTLAAKTAVCAAVSWKNCVFAAKTPFLASVFTV